MCLSVLVRMCVGTRCLCMLLCAYMFEHCGQAGGLHGLHAAAAQLMLVRMPLCAAP